MLTPVLSTVSYTCIDNKVHLVWEYDKEAISYEIYRNNVLLETIELKDLDRPFMFLRFPRNTLFRNKLLKSKIYTDETVQKFNTYEYKIRAVYENNEYSNYSNIKYVKCE